MKDRPAAFNLTMLLSEREHFKEVAKQAGVSMNQFIMDAMQEKEDRMKGEVK